MPDLHVVLESSFLCATQPNTTPHYLGILPKHAQLNKSFIFHLAVRYLRKQWHTHQTNCAGLF